MSFLSKALTFFGFGVSGNLKYEAIDIHGVKWKGVFYDVNAYGITQEELIQYLKAYFYQGKGVRLKSLNLLGYV